MRNFFRLMAPDDQAGAGAGASPAPASAPSPPAPSAAPAPAPAGKDDTPGYWPNDWREKASGGDAKALEALARYATPAEVTKALRAAQVKLTSGELKPVLSAKPTEQELVDWRKSHGIPEAPEKYDLDLGKGFVIGEIDKPLVDVFLKNAHATHQTPDQVKATLRSYYDVQEQISTARAQEDVTAQGVAEEELRAEWGQEFRPNMARIHQHLDRVAGKDLKDMFLSGRLADGTPIGSHPGALKMLLGLALMENPAGVLVPVGGGPQGLDDEIKSIEKAMRTNRKAYDADEKMQARYRDLLDAREHMTKHAKAA